MRNEDEEKLNELNRQIAEAQRRLDALGKKRKPGEPHPHPHRGKRKRRRR